MSELTGPCRKLELTTLRYLSAPLSALKTAFLRVPAAVRHRNSVRQGNY
ncbi:MAG: hypothetical protein ACYSOT_05515 [Planctomycetota bacterium]